LLPVSKHNVQHSIRISFIIGTAFRKDSSSIVTEFTVSWSLTRFRKSFIKGRLPSKANPQ